MKKRSFICPVATGETRDYEDKDCSVRALANAAEMPYYEAHALLTKHGRKMKQGVEFHTFHAAYTEAGFRLKGIAGTTKAAMYFRTLAEGSYIKYTGMSLENALKLFNEGSYIFIIKGGCHAVACVDGELIDTHNSTANTTVQIIYERI